MAAAIRQVVGEANVKPGRVKLDLPPLVENGNTVAMAVSVESPMTAQDHVKAIHVFTEKNPQPNVISVKLGPRAGKADISDPHAPRRHADGRRRSAKCPTARSGPTRSTSSSRSAPAWRIRSDGRAHPHQRARKGQARRGHPDQDADLAHHGDRLPPRQHRPPIPRDIITSFICTYNGEEIFEAALYQAIAANPFITFHTVATESGTFAFQWTGDNGFAAGRLRENHGRMSASRPPRCRASPSAAAGGQPAAARPPKFRWIERRSAYEDMSRDNKAMQDDDTSNPGMLAVLDGEALWNAKAGGSGKSCADCHGDAKTSMKGVAARYPAFERSAGRPVDLEQRINLPASRTRRRKPFAYESKDMLALSAYVAHAVARRADRAARRPAAQAVHRQGPRSCSTHRQGQLNLSCGQCHDDNWGKHLAGNVVPQAHPTGYPIYRLEWQSLGSLQRRLRNCMIGMRAEPYAYGAPEYVDMELYLMWRARGMKMETPAVRP